MAVATFVHEGRTIDYTPTTDTPAGTVVEQGNIVGVAVNEIKANELGALAIEGIFDVPKDNTMTFSVGDYVYWDDTLKLASTVATANPTIGTCVKAAIASDSTVRVTFIPI